MIDLSLPFLITTLQTQSAHIIVLSDYDTAIVGACEIPTLVLRLVNTAGNVSPLLAEVLYKISEFPDVLSDHTVYTLLPNTEILGPNEIPLLLLRFLIMLGNVFPPSKDLRYKISLLPGVLSSHTTCTLFPSASRAGLKETPLLLLRFFITLGNDVPSSIDLLYRISKFPEVLSGHTTCTLLPIAAIAGTCESPALLLRFFIG